LEAGNGILGQLPGVTKFIGVAIKPTPINSFRRPMFNIETGTMDFSFSLSAFKKHASP
jgi:hypothetical protein